MKTIAVSVMVLSIVSVLLVSGAYADRSLPRPGGKGYVQCTEGYFIVNEKGEVLQCVLAVPLIYDVYGGTETCPENNVIRFNASGKVEGCASVKKKKR
ncbi:MAG: hypothetical protein HQK99_08505 [Nitrospirae bacterium]|nr:hypothetical protein [Nitrospirota bacterium]